MQRDPRAFLWDVREAAQAIQSFSAGLDVKGYVGNELVQAAVERRGPAPMLPQARVNTWRQLSRLSCRRAAARSGIRQNCRRMGIPVA